MTSTSGNVLLWAGLGLGAAALFIGGKKVANTIKNNSIYFPDTTLSKSEYQLPETSSEHYIKSGSNTIHAVLNRVPNSSKIILFSHGNAGNLGSRINILEFWANLGYNCIIYDYSGYGKSTGSPNEEQLKQDSLAVWDWLRHDYDANNIILFGNSLGGAVSIWLMCHLQVSNRSQPHSLIIQSSFANIKGFVPYKSLSSLVAGDWRSDKLMGKLVNTQIMIIHSEEDKIIPAQNSVDLAEIASKNGTNSIHFFPAKGGHNSIEMNEDYVTSITNFLNLLS